ncbi:MAG: sulfur carrier protein ThiS [Candidatus Omnitrophica bacterium]|nr:sulfur carrier protein ThiS [Candidatus Omnitrophota bacterium]
MKIKLNGKEQIITEGMTLSAFIRAKALVPDRIVVEHNARIVPSDEWENVYIKDNDILEILSFVGGG